MTEIIKDPTPPILHGPSDKEKKYDRQLRLWAASGQQALEDADLLLINSGAGTVGVETLKNLVLPGIGKFTIADEATVTEEDLGVNFFLDEECLGKSRAECCVKLLQELNPDVQGEWQPKEVNLTELLGQRKYTLIMYTHPISVEDLNLVKAYSQENKVPRVAIHAAGFYSYFRIHLPGTFPIVDTHPDSTATTDLRLLTPWEELSKFAADQTSNMGDMDNHKHGHIPYVALLLHFLEKWKETNGSYPSTYKQKTEFKKMVASGARTDIPEGGEENFEEAAAAVIKTISSPSLSSSVREVFEYEPNEFEANTSFWIIANAIKQFYDTHNALPLPGSVPDMKAQSSVYVQLQNIYKAKARKDTSEVLEAVRNHPSGKTVEVAEVDNFCKNAAFIKLVHDTESRPVDISTVAKNEFDSDAMVDMTQAPLSLIPIYLALDATTHAFQSTSSDAIIAQLKGKIDGALFNERIENIAQEVARAKGGELHNISALTGGMVAQEVIKIITKQYIPIDNTCIFDGITSRAQVLRI